jgi:hypothetical protein
LTEHLSQNQVQGYCQRRLPVVELLSVSDHVDTCKDCREQIETVLNGDAAFFAMRSEVFGADSDSTHATVEQTASDVDGTLLGEELQTVSDHLHRCEQCTRAVDDLRAFKDQIAHQINVQYSPASVPARSEGRRRRLVFLPSFAVRYPTFAIGAALTVLVVAVTGWFVWRAMQKEPITADIAVSPPPLQQEPPIDQVPVIAQLNDSDGRVTLNQTGQLSGVDRLPPTYQNIVKEALTNQRIEASPSLKGLVRPPSSLMSADRNGVNFSVIEPAGKVLLTDRPTFHWSELTGATSYVVEIYDSQLNLVVASAQLTARSWAPPKSLALGRVYSWQVKAIEDDKTFVAPRPPAPQAKFRILDGATIDELAEARRAYASSHLLMGMLYAKAGLLDEARQEFRALEAANPGSEIARKLLASLTPARR